MSTQDPQVSRRDVWKTGVLWGTAVPLLSLAAFAWAQVRPPAAGSPPAEPSPPECPPVSDRDPTVKAMQYVPDGSKVSQRPKKMDTEGKDQSCANCQLYNKVGELKGREYGRCTMFAQGCVEAKGWCLAWVKKH